MVTNEFVRRLWIRFATYSLFGFATFAPDLIIAFGLIALGIQDALAFAIGFFLGVTVNYFANYHVTYRGTHRDIREGYMLFLGFALAGALIIAVFVTLLAHIGIAVFLARIIAALIIGTLNFILNTFCNFKLV